jgi:hypothetical protein
VAVTSSVRVLVAGVDRDSRGAVESEIRRLFASRPAGEAWTVSLVQLAGNWSATVDGPQVHNMSFTAADEPRLLDALRRVVNEAGGGVARASTATASPDDTQPAQPASAPTREPHGCDRCGQVFVVVYERKPDEPQVRTPVACPHCWALNFVEVGDWAAAGHDYRAEKG